jgi:hypothetical protein
MVELECSSNAREILEDYGIKVGTPSGNNMFWTSCRDV